MSRSHIYESFELSDWSIDENGHDVIKDTGVFVKVIKPEYHKIWQELLTPEEKVKYDNLSFMEQLQVSMSTNPFRSLGAEE